MHAHASLANDTDIAAICYKEQLCIVTMLMTNSYWKSLRWSNSFKPVSLCWHW